MHGGQAFTMAQAALRDRMKWKVAWQHADLLISDVGALTQRYGAQLAWVLVALTTRKQRSR
jgi:hypothetical protein